MYLISLNFRFVIVGIRTRQRKQKCHTSHTARKHGIFHLCVTLYELNWIQKTSEKVTKRTLLIVRRGTGRAHTHQSSALQCSMKTNKAIFKEAFNKKGSSNKNGRVTGQSHRSAAHWELSLVCEATVELLELPVPSSSAHGGVQPFGQGKTPRNWLIPVSVCKSELSLEATSSLSLPLSSDFIQTRLFLQKNKTPETTSNQTSVSVAEQAKGRGKKIHLNCEMFVFTAA